MTETVDAPMSPVGPGPEYRGVGIWLPQLYLENARQGAYTIEGRTFVDCLLEGPAIVLPAGGVRFDDCFFGQHGGDPKVMILTPLAGYQALGVIPFKDCRFERCRFLGVGFTGDAAFLQQLLQVMGEPSA